MIIPQGLCLVGADGAGAEYMNNFDNLPGSVREALRETQSNLCLECLCMIAERIERRPRFACSSRTYHELIIQFERGEVNDLRDRYEDSRGFREEKSFGRFYGSTYNPPPYVTNPWRRTSGYSEYFAPGEFRGRMDRWSRDYSPDIFESNNGPATAKVMSHTIALKIIEP